MAIMIPQWLFFQSEVCIAFTLENWLAQPKAWLAWLSCQIRYAYTTGPWLHNCHVFQSGSFWFTWFCTRIRISLGLKIGINSFYNDLYRKEILFWYHVNKYRKMYRDENNELVLEWNWFLRDGELFEINQSSQGLINVTWCDLCPTELNCTNPFQQTP